MGGALAENDVRIIPARARVHAVRTGSKYPAALGNYGVFLKNFTFPADRMIGASRLLRKNARASEKESGLTQAVSPEILEG